jgi:ribosomal protein L28
VACKRVSKVNLRSHRLLIDGCMQTVRTCTRCLRTMVKTPKAKVPKASLPTATT